MRIGTCKLRMQQAPSSNMRLHQAAQTLHFLARAQSTVLDNGLPVWSPTFSAIQAVGHDIQECKDGVPYVVRGGEGWCTQWRTHQCRQCPANISNTTSPQCMLSGPQPAGLSSVLSSIRRRVASRLCLLSGHWQRSPIQRLQPTASSKSPLLWPSQTITCNRFFLI